MFRCGANQAWMLESVRTFSISQMYQQSSVIIMYPSVSSCGKNQASMLKSVRTFIHSQMYEQSSVIVMYPSVSLCGVNRAWMLGSRRNFITVRHTRMNTGAQQTYTTHKISLFTVSIYSPHWTYRYRPCFFSSSGLNPALPARV